MAEAVQVTRYRAFDGAMFDTEAEALDHEEANFEMMLVNLSLAEVRAAISRDPKSLPVSDALEKAGAMIARARREAGEFRRASPRRTSGELDAAADQAPQTPPHDPVTGEIEQDERETEDAL